MLSTSTSYAVIRVNSIAAARTNFKLSGFQSHTPCIHQHIFRIYALPNGTPARVDRVAFMDRCNSGLGLSNCTRAVEADHVIGFGYALIVVWITVVDTATDFAFDRMEEASFDSGKEEY